MNLGSMTLEPKLLFAIDLHVISHLIMHLCHLYIILQLRFYIKRGPKGYSLIIPTVVISGRFWVTFNLFTYSFLYCLTFYSKHVFSFIFKKK